MAREASFMHEDMGDTDEEQLLGRPFARFSPSGFTKTRVAALTGCLALAACLALTATSWQHADAADVQQPHTARSVLESDELADAATDNVMKSGRMLIQESQREHVRSKTRQYFRDLTEGLQKKDPEGLGVLEKIRMSDEQKGAVVRSLASLTDPRVQRLGLYVAKAVRESPTGDQADIERRVKDTLSPHIEEIRQLEEDFHLQPLRELMGGGGLLKDWHLDLDPGRIQVLKTFGDDWKLKIASSTPAVGQAAEAGARRLQDTSATASPLHRADEAFAIIKMIFDQARTVLGIVRQAAPMFGKDLNVNTWITSAIGIADFLFETVSCELDGADQGMKPVQMAICPLASSSAGMDAMRWMLGFVGILPDNIPEDGHTGNHAGEPVVT